MKTAFIHFGPKPCSICGALKGEEHKEPLVDLLRKP